MPNLSTPGSESRYGDLENGRPNGHGALPRVPVIPRPRGHPEMAVFLQAGAIVRHVQAPPIRPRHPASQDVSKSTLVNVGT
jgi:hypothetical protein